MYNVQGHFMTLYKEIFAINFISIENNFLTFRHCLSYCILWKKIIICIMNNKNTETHIEVKTEKSEKQSIQATRELLSTKAG